MKPARVCLLTLALAALPLASAFAQRGSMPAVAQPWSHVESFDHGWLYLETNAGEPPVAYGEAVTLPHSWNAKDTLKTTAYRRGVSWYHRQLEITELDLRHRIFLRFGAIAQTAEVFLNGQPLVKHATGYSAFTVELTAGLHMGSNRIDVRVSNVDDKNLLPSSDRFFNLYGGIYRHVQLIGAPRVCLSRNHLGGPGVRVWSESVSATEADLHVQALIDTDGTDTSTYRITAELLDPAGKVVSIGRGRSGRFQLPSVAAPQLWSPEEPALYTLVVRLFDGDKEVDRAKVRHGFRFFEFTPDRGFFLNGQPYKLQGFNRHQDSDGYGSAVPLERHYDDIRLMKESGANWLRLAHYQQDDYVLQLCDELGLLVWEEIPWVGAFPENDNFHRNAHIAMEEMIEQHFNHPSIIVWGMGNEIIFRKGEDGKSTEWGLVKELNDLIHREDPVRRSGIVDQDADFYVKLKIADIPDVIGYNLYRGWYGGTVDQLTARLSELHRLNPKKPMILTEYGAGASFDLHSETPKQFDQTQEYQVYYLESHLDQIEKLPWLSGHNWWLFADFNWATAFVPKMINNKGLLTFDRKQKKDTFYLFKARYSTEPVLHLCSPDWTVRAGAPEKTYRVITNCDQVELFHDGKPLGVQTATFRWPVTLHEGENRLEARGRHGDVPQQHGFTVTYRPWEPLVTPEPAAKASH